MTAGKAGAIEFLPNYAMQVVTDTVERITAAADETFLENSDGAAAAHELASQLAHITLEWLRRYPS